MLKIETGLETRALKVVIYGAEGIGKSTFASQFPNPLFLDTAGGTSSLNVRRVKCGKVSIGAYKRKLARLVWW